MPRDPKFWLVRCILKIVIFWLRKKQPSTKQVSPHTQGVNLWPLPKAHFATKFGKVEFLITTVGRPAYKIVGSLRSMLLVKLSCKLKFWTLHTQVHTPCTNLAYLTLDLCALKLTYSALWRNGFFCVWCFLAVHVAPAGFNALIALPTGCRVMAQYRRVSKSNVSHGFRTSYCSSWLRFKLFPEVALLKIVSSCFQIFLAKTLHASWSLPLKNLSSYVTPDL